MSFKLGLIQLKVIEGKENNLRNARVKIIEAAENGANIIALPEMFNCPFSNDNFAEYGEVYPGETTTLLSQLANEKEVYIIGGSIPEIVDEKIYNTAYCFNPKGELIGKHRKVHLFDVDVKGGITFKESDTLTRGDEFTVIETEYGKIGIAVCFDMRFPEQFRKMSLKGAKAIIVPAAFNMVTGPAHWHITARTRAMDNQVYMALISPARDPEGVYIAYGHTIVTSPWGNVLSELDEEEGILYQDIDFDYVEKIRNELPLLKSMRTDLY